MSFEVRRDRCRDGIRRVEGSTRPSGRCALGWGSRRLCTVCREADCLLPEIALPDDGLLYVGESGNLRERDHLVAQHSGFSSPRRSLGAILKARLGLTVIPRASGSSQTNMRNFRFAGDGEPRLSEWMLKNLEYAVVPFSGDVKELEARIIEAYGPPLNLKAGETRREESFTKCGVCAGRKHGDSTGTGISHSGLSDVSAYGTAEVFSQWKNSGSS